MQGFEHMRDALAEGGGRYATLDAAQIVKHAFGLRTQALMRGKQAALITYPAVRHLILWRRRASSRQFIFTLLLLEGVAAIEVVNLDFHMEFGIDHKRSTLFTRLVEAGAKSGGGVRGFR